MIYRLTTVGRSDLPLIRAWLAAPAVRQWWGDPATAMAGIRDVIKADWAEAQVAAHHGRPFAYLQWYAAAEEPSGFWRDMPTGTWGMDLLIGDPTMLDRGHGTALAAQAAATLLARPAVRRVFVDPDPRNARAIRCFEKAGFARGETRQSPEGEILLMTMDGDPAPDGESSPETG